MKEMKLLQLCLGAVMSRQLGVALLSVLESECGALKIYPLFSPSPVSHVGTTVRQGVSVSLFCH